MGSPAASSARGGVAFPAPSSLSAGPTGSPPRTGIAQPAAVVAEPASANDEEDDDFGDFAGAQEGAQPPAAPATGDDEGDDFGDFAGAPASVAAAAATSAMTAAVTAAASGAGSVAAATGGDSGGDDMAWMMEDGALSSPSGRGTGKGAGLDDLIKSNLNATAAGPVHLADMVSAGRPLNSSWTQ